MNLRRESHQHRLFPAVGLGMVLRASALAALVATVAVPSGALAQTQPSGPCQFVLGFKTLHDMDPGDIGDCVDNQYFTPNGDANQHTTKGLMAWRKADNYTAFTNGYMTWVNGPYGLQSRLNTALFPWETPPPPAPPAPVAPPVPAPTPTPTATPVVSPQVSFTEDGGFSPNVLTISAGQTVTWTNNSANVHNVSQDGGGFNSGGWNPGATFSFTFSQPGTYSYHSSTEEVYTQDPNNASNTIVSYKYTGTIVVQ